jgi:hypothetical protein
MRPDFGKCVIERERRGSSSRSAKARWYGKIVEDEDGFDYDGMSHLPSSRKQEGYYKQKIGYKDFTDVLGPIDGFLMSSVGRYWPKVYSELTRNLGHGPWAVRHILHAHISVAVNTYRGVDGKVWHLGKLGPEVVDGGYRTEFYVEPETKILRKHPDARRGQPWRYRNLKPSRTDLDRVEVSDGVWCVRMDSGIWFRGRYESISSEKKSVPAMYPKYRAVPFIDPVWPDIKAPLYGMSLVFRKEKSCSGKEIKEAIQVRDSGLRERFPGLYKSVI